MNSRSDHPSFNYWRHGMKIQFITPNLKSRIPPWPLEGGVRQGCKAAPGLWTLFTLLFLHDVMDHVTIEWLQRHVTIYADDFHFGCIFESLAELAQFQQVLGIMFSTMASLDMIINPSKSVAIVALRGSKCKAVRHQFIWRDHTGEEAENPCARTWRHAHSHSYNH